MGGVGKGRECKCKKEGESLFKSMFNFVSVCVRVCVCVHTCMWFILQQLLGLNLVSLEKKFVISSEIVSISSPSTPPPPRFETSCPTQCAHASRSLSLRLSCTLSLSRSTGLFSPSHSVSPSLISCFVS